jgi:hypothetical protein
MQYGAVKMAVNHGWLSAALNVIQPNDFALF